MRNFARKALAILTVMAMLATISAVVLAEGTALSLNAYTNQHSTNEGNNVYTLDTNEGDASLYFWSDNVVAALKEGKSVAFKITGEIPTSNADDCFSFGYMQRDNHNSHWELAHLDKGDVDEEVVLTPSTAFELELDDIWNFCVYSSSAAGHDNTATLTITATVYNAGEGPQVTAAPVDTEGKPLQLNAYTNQHSTNEGNNVYTLDTNEGDASLYFWSDNVVAALKEGKSVAFKITGEIPTSNADDCFSFGYMQRNNFNDHWELAHLYKGDVDEEVVLTPSTAFELELDDIWNFCVYSSNAAGHDNTATLTITATVYNAGGGPVATAAPAEGKPLQLNAYTNQHSTNEGNNVYTLDTNEGDASLYFWSDNVVAALKEGKSVAFKITGEIPTSNADDCFSFGYMQRDNFNDHWELVHLDKGDVDEEVVISSNTAFELELDDIWNFCVYSSSAAGHDNTATLTITATVYNAGGGSVVTQAPATNPPIATEVPADLIRAFDIRHPYVNGSDGSYEVVNGNELHYIKDKAGANFSQIFWANNEEIARTDTTTLQFDARVAGGEGHSWDGYAFSLRYDKPSYADHEVLRLVPTATGVDIAIGAGTNTLAKVDGTDYHAYSVVYNRTNATVSIYVDGTKVIDEAEMGVETESDFQGYMVKSGNNNATECEMWLKNVSTWRGEQVRKPESGGDTPTDEPTEEPQTYVLGDYDGNGIVNAKDVTLLRRGVANQATAADHPAGDFDKNGILNAKDVTLLRRAIANQTSN